MNQWLRVLGVSIRPWSGQAPHWLLIQGVIQVAICIFFLVMGAKMVGGGELEGTVGELSLLRGWGLLIIVAVVVMSALGALKIVIGALDLIPRLTVTGTVLSLRERRFLDFLPYFAQQAVFFRGPGRMDKRRPRTEVVLNTSSGPRQWTVRNFGTARSLPRGAHVRISVSPLIGYVAKVEPLA